MKVTEIEKLNQIVSRNDMSGNEKEPNFINEPISWLTWNMKTYDNTLKDALTLLKQREAIGKF